jgi:hypothetical protein
MVSVRLQSSQIYVRLSLPGPSCMMRWMRIRALHWGQLRLTSPVPKIVSIFDMKHLCRAIPWEHVMAITKLMLCSPPFAICC